MFGDFGRHTILVSTELFDLCIVATLVALFDNDCIQISKGYFLLLFVVCSVLPLSGSVSSREKNDFLYSYLASYTCLCPY